MKYVLFVFILGNGFVPKPKVWFYEVITSPYAMLRVSNCSGAQIAPYEDRRLTIQMVNPLQADRTGAAYFYSPEERVCVNGMKVSPWLNEGR